MPTRPTLILALAIALLQAAAHAAPLAAGSQRGAWVVAPGSRDGALLFFLPADASDALAHGVTSFPTRPLAIACEDDAAIVLFPRRPSVDPDAQIYPIRRITRRPEAGARPEFSRPEILAPLPDGGDVLALALVDQTPLVLRRRVAPSGSTLTLDALRASGWRPIDLPPGTDATAPAWITSIGRRPVLAQQQRPGAVRLWSLSSFDEPDAPAHWTEQSVRTPHPIDALLAFPAGPRAIASTGPDTIAMLALDDGRFAAAHTLRLDRSGQSEAPWGAGIALFWNASGTDAGIELRLLDADAQSVYDGPLAIAGPVSPTELQILIILLCSVFFTAIVFMLRPETRASAPLSFPPGAAIASPVRRALAFLIDLLPGLGVASFVWFADARSLADVTAMLTGHGAAPILAVAAITIALNTIGEATTGRTLGKAVTRCRTISYTGGRPLWRQALARNTIKVLCPPVGLFILLSPASPHPGSFDTLVIVEHSPDPPHGPPGDPSDPS